VGTPRGLQGRGGRAVAALLYLMHIVHGTAYGQSRRLVLNSVVASFELLVFALILCRHRNRDLRHGLLGLVRSTDRSQAWDHDDNYHCLPRLVRGFRAMGCIGE
jgi:hypothetical protein